MRINKLLILFILFLVSIQLSHANSVSGLYMMPVHSVKFEKRDNFSFLPIGWSKNSNTAFLIYNRASWSTEIPGGAKLIIVNAIEDTVIWQSDVYEINNDISLSVMWNNNIDLFSEKLSLSDIVPDENPQYGGTGFTIDGVEYRISSEQSTQTGFNGISTISLVINSDKMGSKSLFKYVGDPDSANYLMDFYALGYFKSPFEKRIAVVSVEDYLSKEGNDSINIRISGAHLSIGYKREINEETRLIDAVISGQYYNSKNLLLNGADPDCIVHSGDPLIVMAALQGNWDIVFLLLEFGADLEGKDKLERNLLHYAAIDGNEEVLRKLLGLGINRRFTDIDGETAFSLAVKNNHSELLRLLR